MFTSGTLVLKKNTFVNNTAGGGGAVSVAGVSHIALADFRENTFDGNQAGIGGAVQLEDAIAASNGDTFTNNTATFAGGAITAVQVPSLSIHRGHFAHNSAMNGRGGAISSQSSGDISIHKSTFTQNSSLVGVGAVYSGENQSLVIDDSTFEHNAGGFGGAIELSATTSSVIENSRFTKNFGNFGGGISVEGPMQSFVIHKNRFEGNTAQFFGGAISALGLLVETLHIEKNHFKKNSAFSPIFSSRGGAYHQFRGTSTIVDNRFDDNVDPQGDEMVINLPASVNGFTTAAGIIASLEEENKKLDASEIAVLP